MNDLISRQAAIDKTYELREHFKCWDRDDDVVIRKAYADIPAADVRKNVHAKKVIGGGERDGSTCWFECSHCHGTVDLQDMFCKHCGAVLEYEK